MGCLTLPPADLDKKMAAITKRRRGVGQQLTKVVKAILPTDKSSSRLKTCNLLIQLVIFSLGNIWRIAEDEIETARLGKRLTHVSRTDIQSGVNAMALGILGSASYGHRAQVQRHTFSLLKEVRDRHGQNTGSRSEIRKAKPVAGPEEFLNLFHDVLGFRTRNENPRTNGKIEPEKFALAEDVCGRLTRSPSAHEFPDGPKFVRRQLPSAIGDKPHPIERKRMTSKHLRGKKRGIHALLL